MPQLTDLPSIDAIIQKQTIAIDFGKFLPSGVTLTGTPTVTISVVSGTDASPSSRLSGAAQIETVATAKGGTGLANTAILQQLQNLVGGVKYLLVFTCDRSDNDIATAWTHAYGVTPA